MAQMWNIAFFGFCLIFGMSTAEIDMEWFEGASPELCIANVVGEYLDICAKCKEINQNKPGEIPLFNLDIKEVDALIPAVILGPESWACVYKQLETHPDIQQYFMFCASQIIVDSIDLQLRMERVCECTIYNLATLCKEKKPKKKN